MKISVFDPYKGKFFQDMVDRWIKDGHSVKYERYYDPEMVEWADVVWFETCDNNFHTASSGAIHGEPHEGWNMHDMDLSNKQVIIRVIDIEAWYGHHGNGDWGLVDDVIFIAPHIQELVKKDVDFSTTNTKEHVINCGVNMDRYTLSKDKDMKKIAWVCEKWATKGIDYALQIMAQLPNYYELHALGPWNDRYAWEKAYQEDFIEKNNIKYIEYDWVDDVNDFYQDKGHILSASKKEAFGYSIAEGMATGCNPVIHRFYGADAIWPGITWNTIDEAVSQIKNETVKDTRGYLENHGLTFDNMYKRIMEEVVNVT